MNAYWTKHLLTELKISLIIAPLSVQLASLVFARGLVILSVCVLCVLTHKEHQLSVDCIWYSLFKKLTVNDVIKQFCSSGSSRSSSSIALNLSPCKENLTFSLRISSSETDSLHLIVGWVFANCYSVRVTWQARYPNFFCPTLKFASLCPGQHQVSSWWDSTVSSSMLPWCQVNQGES